MRSWQSFLFEKLLISTGRRKKFLSEKGMQQFISSKERLGKYHLQTKFALKHQITIRYCEGLEYYVLNEYSASPKTIVYFHGGAYINDPLLFHWRFLVKIAKETGYKILVPMYPKLPRSSHVHCYEALAIFYKQVITSIQDDFIFMGDSAGGGLALGLAQKLQKEGLKGPRKLILLSPWLDVTGDHPDYAPIEKNDPMLGIKGAKILGKMWAQPSTLDHYLVSPLYGSFEGLGDITLIVGTAELLLVDARRLKSIFAQKRMPLQYYEFPKMNHVFPVFPIPEATLAWQIIYSELVN